MKKFVLSLILVMFMSCQSTKKILNVYIHNSSVDGSEIFGNPKEGFFGKNAKDIRKINVDNSKKYVDELTIIKGRLLKSQYSFNASTLLSPNGEDILDGYYTYAFEWNENILYSDETMKSWLYIDEHNNVIKTLYFESHILDKKFK